jgi:phosphoinositide-3-kinase, regulatory subunit 4
MGQGYSLTTLSAGSASIDIPELADLDHEKSLGTARFMKSIRARNQQGLVFVKAFVKPYSSFDLRKYLDAITEERNALADISNALGYQRILETDNGGFLARQYIHSSVYDRISTRPFLDDIEKKWMAYQLLCALRDCHARDVFHGDIKSENLLVTSWNWLFLTDFSSSFKPTYLPEDNPAEFSFYFDTSGRRTCYLAPERFISAGDSQTDGGINWAMDIFSAGCVIAELFLEGPIFTLSQLFRYRKGDLSLEHTHLDKIKDNDVRELIRHMIRLEPESRYAAEEILTFWRGKVFPEYFYGFLHQYMALLTDSSSGRKPVSLETNVVESDERIERVYADFDKISYFLGYPKPNDRHQDALPRLLTAPGVTLQDAKSQSQPIADQRRETDKGTLIFLSVVVSSLRNTSKAAARLKACDLLLAFGQRLPDDVKLDRILPYIVVLLSDSSDMVRVAALRSMTQLLDTVKAVSPINAYIFPEYIFPKLRTFMLGPSSEPSPVIRTTYASCLASLAQSSARVLDVMQAIKADGRLPELEENDWASEATFHGLYDVARVDLVSHFEDATKALITDPEPAVRRAFLGSVPWLCVFFGSSTASDVILSHLNTYLNDQDWILKCAFIRVLVAVAAFVGGVNLEKFILPLMVQSLTDPETFVVERVIRSLASMAELQLIQRSTLWEVLRIVVRFLIHPSLWIREASANFVTSCGKHLEAGDRYCIVLPLLQPFLRIPIVELSEFLILDALKKPLPKSVLDMAMVWATKVEKGVFWRNAIRDSVFLLPEPGTGSRTIPSARQFHSRIPSTQRNEEDEQWLTKLRGLGMQPDDEVKLLALREFIWRVAHRRPDTPDITLQGQLNNVMSLNQIDVTPQNIFFDNKEPVREVKGPDRRRSGSARTAERPHTIAEALLEASATIDDIPFDKESNTNDQERERFTAVTRPRQIGKQRGDENRSSSDSPHSFPNSPANLSEQDSARSPKTRLQPQAASLPGQRLSIRKSSDNSLQYRSSAINLLNRKDSSKADAATATTSENAFGKLDGPLHPRRTTGPSPLSLAAVPFQSPRPKSPSRESVEVFYEPNHSYSGNDRNILRLLDNHFLENYPADLFDFGPSRQPIDPRAPIPLISESAQLSNGAGASDMTTNHSEPWSPTGQLLTIFNEHQAAVNCVVPAPDHAFFVTASDDGTCRIWDTTRLEKNVTPRSRQTYRHPHGAKFKALCFVDGTHTFIAASDEGSIHIVKVDYKKIDGGESTRYGKLTRVRQYQIPQPDTLAEGTPTPEHAIQLSHHRTPASHSTLLLLTTSFRILALDLKTMTPLYTLSNPPSHGTPTTFTVDKKHNWLLLGTAHGIFSLWDLRFCLRIRSWGLKSGARISRLALHPSKGRGRWIVAAAGREISVWDIEKPVCKEVYRPASDSGPAAAAAAEAAPTRTAAIIASTKPYEPWFPDDEAPEKLLSRFGAHVGQNGALTDPAQTSSADPQGRIRSTGSLSAGGGEEDAAITALWVGYDNVAPAASSGGQEPVKAPFMVSGGVDRRLRFWDLTRPEFSAVVSGMEAKAEEGFEVPRMRYETSHPGGQIMLVEEVVASASSSAAGGRDQAGPSSRRGGSRASNAGAAPAAGTKPTRSTVISKQQQVLLRNHVDTIADVCVLARPYGMVVSVDRGGGVFVYQ